MLPILALLVAGRVATPVLNPASGTYTAAQSVTVTTTSTGAAIYCTTDGSRPKRSAALRYTAQIAVSSTSTVQCVAYTLDGRAPSRIASASYTISGGASGTPAEMYAAAVSTVSSMPIRSTGTTYYYCRCDAGAQSGCQPGTGTTGCTTGAPCLGTWGDIIARFNSMQGGDTVALCRGGAWSVATGSECQYLVANTSCGTGTTDPAQVFARLKDPTNTSTCDLRDYAPAWGGTNRPLLAAAAAADLHFMTRSQQSPTAASTNGVRILNLAFRGTNGGVGILNANSRNQRAFFASSCAYGEPVDDGWMWANNSFDHLREGISTVTGALSHYLVWGNYSSQVDRNVFYGFGSNLWIDANKFEDSGAYQPGDYSQAHVIYLGSGNLSFGTAEQQQRIHQNIAITSNQIIRTPDGPQCTAGALVGHLRVDGFNVENNVVDMWTTSGIGAGCWGGFTAASSEATAWRNMRFHRNWIRQGSNGISIGSAPGAIIENNVVVLPNASSWMFGIVGGRDAARADDGRGGAPAVPDDVSNNMTIRNNTIHMPSAQAGASGIVVGVEGTGHVIANNAMEINAAAQCFHTTLGRCSVTTGQRCSLGTPNIVGTTVPCPGGESCVTDATAYAFIGNNACHGPANWGTTYDATPHVTADPLFTSAPTDFTPLPGSPLIGAGSSTYRSTVDFNLTQRPTPPAIGALEPAP